MQTTINPAITKVIEPETIDITLTKDEAGILASIVGKVEFSSLHDRFDLHQLHKTLIRFCSESGQDTDHYFNNYQKLVNGTLKEVDQTL